LVAPTVVPVTLVPIPAMLSAMAPVHRSFGGPQPSSIMPSPLSSQPLPHVSVAAVQVL